MKKLITFFLAMALACGSLISLTACEKKSLKAGLICLHNSNSTYDKNFIDAFEAACAAKGLSSKEYSIITDIAESNDCYKVATELADDGCKVVFADSFGHEDFMMQAAREYTDVEFCHATGTKALLNAESLPNFHNAFASIYEGRYLTGVAAGLKLQEMIANNTLSDKAKTVFEDKGVYYIGYVGAFTYAEVVSGYTAFYLGVKSVVENVEMLVKFTGSWLNEEKERNVAADLIDQGCALISQHADSNGAPTACQTAGIPNVSYNINTSASGPDTYVIASKINWQPYFEYMLDCALNGTTIDTDKTGSLKDNSVVVLEPSKNAAAGTADKLAEVKAKLESGELNVFDCSTFTVTVTADNNTAAQVDENGHLVAYNVAFGEESKNVIENGVFAESKYRSAPYFDVKIDGITLLNVDFG